MKSKFWGFFILITVSAGEIFSVTPNFRIFPSINLQVETSIATHPLNPQIIAGSCITDIYPGGYTTGAYISTNGGNTWTGTNSIRTSSNAIISTVGDPTIVIDKDGVLILPYVAPSPIQGHNDFRVGVSYSTNNGSSWSATYYVPGVDSADKIVSATDGAPTSPYYGRSYIAYSEKRGVYLSYTTNNGQTWSVSRRVSPSLNAKRIGASIVTGNSGEIFVTWPYIYSSVKYIGFAKSLDGGETWITNDLVIPVVPSPNDFRFNLNLVKLNGIPVLAIDKSGGPNNGKLYIVCNQGLGASSPAEDDYDIVIYSSSNSGSTWSAAILVNQSTNGITRHQFFPNIAVDNNGAVNIMYCDNRNTQTDDSTEIYLSRSEDGGLTFQDIKISDHKFKYTQLSSSERLFANAPYIGSYFGLACAGNKLHTLWFENSSGKYQAWYSSYQKIPDVSIKIIPEGIYNSASNKLNRKDSLKIFLRSTQMPYSRIDSSYSVIDSLTSIGLYNFANSVSGNYYIEAVHKNSITVWSSTYVVYNGLSGMSYDFTNIQSKAYGNNIKLIDQSPVCYGLYSGDVNRDGLIDLPDIQLVEHDAENFMIGEYDTDLNGDRIVDASDLIIIENNSQNYIYVITP
ncbi:MAG: exo-alpha-sialidase [Bacteroidetes bacterium]|nr:exo-alpha-sialidase [Bacteroidota bacterium]